MRRLRLRLRLSPSPTLARGWAAVSPQLNFYRAHLVLFTLVPLVFSGLFYAGNAGARGNAEAVATGRLRVGYVDSLFLCFSAMSVTGLVTVNVSALHPFQQALLFILFILGDYSVVSLVMVQVRKHYFRRHCEQLLANDRLRRVNTGLGPESSTLWTRTFTFRPKANPAKAFKAGAVISAPVDARPQEGYVEDDARRVLAESPTAVDGSLDGTRSSAGDGVDGGRRGPPGQVDTDGRRVGPRSILRGEGGRDSFAQSQPASPRSQPGILWHDGEQPGTSSPVAFVAARDPSQPQGLDNDHLPSPLLPSGPSEWMARQLLRQKSRAMSLGVPLSQVPLSRTGTAPAPKHIPHPIHTKHTGYGGFPSPLQAVVSALPRSTTLQIRRRLTRPDRHLTVARNPTVELGGQVETGWGAKAAAWLPASLGGLVIGRNSRFYTEELDDEELEQLGGVEYRALRLLSRIVFGYILFFQLVPFAILAIYFSRVRSWDAVFQESLGVQDAAVDPTWFSLFQVVTTYTGAGMSLVDRSMVPFTSCYLLLYVLDIVMLAGSHALPMTLRLVIWLASKIWRAGEIHESLHFLLDHPRRCFLYLFPSHQTWYLVVVLVAFSGVELFGFLVLNIDLSVLSPLSGWEMFSDGLLQSLSVRAAGFSIVAVADMAPAVLFLYVVLMYVAIYPIAMSVRSTNVYEERALGVYENKHPELLDEQEPLFQGQRGEVFSKYLQWHMRRQLAFDIWPLAAAIFLICIAERGKLLDPATSDWFTVFRIIFECTSAYSTVGLSLGTPNNNFAFSGELSTVSKLIMILVMLRGRHRGLPVAIDRAVMLPREYARIDRRSEAAEPPATKRESNNGFESPNGRPA